MNLFFSSPKRAPAPEPVDIVSLIWCYEVSEDDGETWHREAPGDENRTEILRRGAWEPAH